MSESRIFSAFAVSSTVIRLECVVPEEAEIFEWQYTMEESPTASDWITITISDPSDFLDS